MLDDAIKRAPAWVEPVVTLGTVHYKMGEFKKAEAAYEEALALDPDNRDAKAFLDETRYALAHPPKAGSERPRR